jgi:hypothetical protein
MPSCRDEEEATMTGALGAGAGKALDKVKKTLEDWSESDSETSEQFKEWGEAAEATGMADIPYDGGVAEFNVAAALLGLSVACAIVSTAEASIARAIR